MIISITCALNLDINIKNDLKVELTGDEFGKRISADFKHLFSLLIPFYSEV